MKLLVDGIFFQLSSTGIARLWLELLARLATFPEIKIVMLDRGNCPIIPNVERLPFPSYTSTCTAADSFLIDRICKDLDIDVFTTTYYTSALTVPQVLMVYDMIPEILGFNLSDRIWQEKQIAISYSNYFACISKNTLSDLKKFYPHIPNDRMVLAYCGVDKRVFKKAPQAAIEDFRSRYGLNREYFIVVGSRRQHNNYKNVSLLFETMKMHRIRNIDVLCVGGEPNLEDVSSGVAARRLDLDSEELCSAYSGAIALVYPSLYEGFGLPVAEAMASECPVITTRFGSLGEVAGDAAIFISGHDHNEMKFALEQVRSPTVREQLVEKGLRQSALYDWDRTTKIFYDVISRAYSERHCKSRIEFCERWKKLRSLQSAVDVGV